MFTNIKVTNHGMCSRQNVDIACFEVPESVQSAPSGTRSRCGATAARCSTLLVMLDVSLFANRSFLVICVSSAFIQLGYFVPVVFITPYAQSLRLSTSDAALVLSVIGKYRLFITSVSVFAFVNSLKTKKRIRR